MSLQLTEHFTLPEMLASDTAKRLKIPNAPRLDHLRQLYRLAAVLEEVRALLGVPLLISSGYRCPKLNLAVGGSPHSAHLEGRAADFKPAHGTLDSAFEAIQAGGVVYDQLVTERTKAGAAWIHLAIAREGATPRRQALRANDDTGKMSYRIAEG